MSRITLFLTCGVLVPVLIGCGGQDGDLPSRVAVTVVVTQKGTPVEGAHVKFLSTTGGRPAFGVTNAQGTASLSTFGDNDGAIPGQYQVVVRKTKNDAPPPPEAPTAPGPSAPAPIVELLPKKYATAATSGLQATVTEQGDGRFTFDLTD